MLILKVFLLSLFLNANLLQKNNPDPNEEMFKKTKDKSLITKKNIRLMKDKTCEMINGKTQCFAKKVKHKVENGIDSIKETTY